MARNVRTARPRASLQQGRNDWYRIRNLADGQTEVAIYDEIGYFGVTAADFIRELAALDTASITLRLNSPGGEIFDGIAIMNTLRSHPAAVTVQVDSLAASIASVIAMAGDRIVMAPHSQMMIHDGSGLAIGNASDMREMAELLDRQSDNIAAIYAERAGGTPKQWRARMQAETWFTAKEAVEAGLADEVAKMPRREDEPVPANSWDLSIFRYAGREQAPAPTNCAEVVEPPQPAEEPPAGGQETPVDDAPEPAPEGGEPEAVTPEVAVPDLTGWDPTLFRTSMARAAGELTDWDPDMFRTAMQAGTTEAHAPTRHAEAPAAPAAPPTEPAAPEPEPARDWSGLDLFRAAVEMEANNAPAPTAPAPLPEPEADPYDPTVVTRALREASR